MSDAVAALAANCAHAQAFRARILPLFEPGTDIPWIMLRIIDGLLENNARACDWRSLAHAARQAAAALRLLEQWRAMANFLRLAAELDREADRTATPSLRSLPDVS